MVNFEKQLDSILKKYQEIEKNLSNQGNYNLQNTRINTRNSKNNINKNNKFSKKTDSKENLFHSDIKESEAGSSFFYSSGANSRLLKKTGIRLNTGIHLGNGYWLENSVGSSFTWNDYIYDNEFEPKLIFCGKFNYNPTVHVNNVYSRPNNLGDNNDEVVWRDFWDGLCP